MGRRAAGEGSIYPVRDKDGRTIAYAAAISLGYTDGKRNRKKVQRKTRKDVAEEIARLKAQKAQGVDLKARQPTVREFCTPWLEDTFALKARPKSVETYRQMFLYHIFPAVGDQKFNKVAHRRIQTLVTEMHAAGFADKTISLVRAAGRQAWAAAIREGLVERNPFQGLTLPTGNVRKAIALTVAQARALLHAARGDRLEVALRLMLSLGLRRGEVCGLRWDKDVDLKKGTLTVHGTLQYIQGKGLTWGEPKTDAGERSFKLPPALLAALVWHKQQQEKERHLMGKLWHNSNYVFVSSTTGGPLNSNNIYNAFKRAAAIAELPDEATPHTLRHSCASFLHAEGASLKKISVYLGHANTTITNQVYIHLFQDELDDGAATVDDLLSDTGS
jgi:integrase